MKQFPEAYAKYLEGRDEDFIATVRPVLLQSAADQNFGVRIVKLPHGYQAHTDEHVPFGEILEDVD